MSVCGVAVRWKQDQGKHWRYTMGMAPTAQSDIRRSRVYVAGEALVRGPDGDFRAPLRDLSITGLHMLRPPGFALRVGQAVEVEVSCGPPQAGIAFLLMARVARADSDTVGLRFAPMPDRMARTLERVLSQYGTLHTGGPDERRGRR